MDALQGGQNAIFSVELAHLGGSLAGDRAQGEANSGRELELAHSGLHVSCPQADFKFWSSDGGSDGS